MSDVKAFEKFAAQYDTLGNKWQDMGADEYFKAGWKAACEWRDSQVGEPVIYQCRMQPTWTDRQPWTSWSECTKGTYEDCKRVRVNGDWRYESRALYTAPPAAQINQQLVRALEEMSKEYLVPNSEDNPLNDMVKAALAAAKETK